MKDKAMPEMIWVLLDERSPTGTHEFADSVNNGPWGKALTAELIPHLESTYRMDGVARGTFPARPFFWRLGDTLASDPLSQGVWRDVVDFAGSKRFHDFTGPDLYAPKANLYRKADGSPYFLVRDKQKELATLEQFAKLEQTLGSYGGQLASFEWVFSPRGADGRPVP